MCRLTGVSNVEYPQPAGPAFRAEIDSVSADGVVLSLSGEVDISNQRELDAALTAMMATKARNALIDASGCTFMSLQGYAAIGRCSSELDTLTLRTCLGVAGRALRLLGFDGVVCVRAPEPCLASKTRPKGTEIHIGSMSHSLAAQGVG